MLGENGILNLSSLIQVLDDNEIKFDMEFSELQDITKMAIKIENSIKVGNDFEKKETLQSNNNIVLNNINEASRTKIINQLTQTIQKNIDKNK